MENRFIDMNLLLKGKAGRNGQNQTRNGSAAYSQTQSSNHSRQFGAISYTVPGLVAPLKQENSMACWATVATMMIMWKKQQSIPIDDAIASIGTRYLRILKANTGLSATDKAQFLRDGGFAFEYPSSFSIEGWEGLLRSYGPIWVTTQEGLGIHARIIISISGDGTPDGTSLSIIDPARGNQYQEKFANFLVKYEREVRESGADWTGRIQIVHWPEGVSVAKSFSNDRTHSWVISQQGLDIIKGFEGFRGNKYNDPVGHCTIGYGTLLHKGNCNGDVSEQPYSNGITEDQATHLLVDKLNEFQRTINDSVTVELSQNQFDSLVSFTYNVGTGNFKQSTLLRLLNQGNYGAIPTELRKWTKAHQNGQVVELPGLVRRRSAEAELFQNGNYVVSQSIVSMSLEQYEYSNHIPISYAKSVTGILNGGTVTDPFYRNADERMQLSHRSTGRAEHLGIDISLSNATGGGITDPRRGLPVYAAIKSSIPISDLNSVRIKDGTGMHINGDGNANLQNALVLTQPWSDGGNAYGGVLGLACRYAYNNQNSQQEIITLYIEFLHLITRQFSPKDGSGKIIALDKWLGQHPNQIDFGPLMINNAVLQASQFVSDNMPLVGYLGATEFPHVHVQAAFAKGEQKYLRAIRFDPEVMIY